MPSWSTSVPLRPKKPASRPPGGAVKVTAAEVGVPAVRVRPWSVVSRAEKIRVRPSFWPWVRVTWVIRSPGGQGEAGLGPAGAAVAQLAAVGEVDPDGVEPGATAQGDAG